MTADKVTAHDVPPDDVTADDAALRCHDVRIEFRPRRMSTRRGDRLVAVDGVSFTLPPGRTLAVVGESGCGKSTLARAIVGVQRCTAGTITASGRRVDRPGAGARPIQMVFQDPYASLDPRRSVGYSVAETVRAKRRLDRRAVAERVAHLLTMVGLDRRMSGRYPHEFSGGQRQRIAIARALGADPEVLVCDEATSALDVSVQAQIVNLLIDVQRDQGFAMVFVTHNLAVVRQLADTVAVMYLGRFVEYGPARQVFAHPTHPYAEALLSAVPQTTDRPGQQRPIALVGDPPDPHSRPAGCHFHPRCWRYERSGRPDVCRSQSPRLLPIASADGHTVACHLVTGPAPAAPGAPQPITLMEG